MAEFSLIPLAQYGQFNGLSVADCEAISTVLVADARPQRKLALKQLLADAEEALPLLDREFLREAIGPVLHQLSDCLQLYLRLRPALLEYGVDDRRLCWYLANVWAEFRHSGILPSLGENEQDGMMPTVDILRQLNFLNGAAEFELLARAGNYYLFLMAMFSSFFERRQRMQGAPGMDYYEAFARCAYRAASDHGMADELALSPLYQQLSSNLQGVRHALTSVAA